MKKVLFTSLLLISIWLFSPNITFGLLSDPLWLDMYKKVDKWLVEMEDKYLTKELKGWTMWGSITDDLNKRAKAKNLKDDCFKKDISVSDIKKIVNDFNLSDMLKECLWEKDSQIWSNTFNKYVEIIKESYAENSKKAEVKVDETYKIWRIWMYSDGVEENSPFDLMLDLDEIDKIIFEQNIPYNWVNTEDLWKVTDGILNWLSPKEAFNLNRYKKDTILFSGKYKDNIDNIDNSKPKWATDGSTQVCTTNTSWLDVNSINGILWDINKNKSNSWNLNNNSWSLNNKTWSLNNNPTWWGWYSKTNDSSMWPCNQFFCIVIKFVMYNHSLLGGWKNLSIEWLIKRSNEHMKKAASTSNIQANMTINLFEIWLKDLSLPDIFHVWTIVSYKPVPMMNVEKDGKDVASDEFKHKNLLTKYYKNLWLDYERANDLNIFKKIDGKLKAILDATEMAQTQSESKSNSLDSYISKMRKENEFISNTIVDKKVINDDMQDFYKQFIELESFTNALLDYTIWAWGIINKMKEIPTGS